jgi:phosphoglucosamine mutase
MGIRLQGTDGIRGPIQQHLPPTEHPVKWYLQTGEITPEFFQLYTYSTCCLLRKFGLTELSNIIVVGWDSRDSSGTFNNAAILGILQAGLAPYSVGILPTPAVALHMLATQASAAIVLTASHNPADQNGVKIFLGSSGLKLFPADDESLTEFLLKQPWPLPSSSIFHDICDASEAAQKNFIAHLLQNQDFEMILDQPESINIITDSAFGACQVIVQHFPKSWSIFQHYNSDCSNEINRFSGVADLEGTRWLSEQHLKNSQWKDHTALHQLFQNLRKNPKSLHLSWIFDGDGDRCFILVADSTRQGIHILSGDALMLLISSESESESQNKYIFNTIESDLEASSRILGKKFNLRQCAVGDKWLLLEAFDSRIKTLKEHLQKFSGAKKDLIDDIQKTLVQMKKLGRPSAFELTRLWRNLIKEIPEANQLSTDFFLGSEESGHVILPVTHNKELVFLGNGPLVAFKATEILYKRWLLNPEEFFKNIEALQPQGTRVTLPIYYVVKEKLLEPRFRDELCQIIQESAGNLYPEFIQDWINLPEDNELLMLQLKDKNTLKIAIFIRNSGTEDKLSLYIQGNGISDAALNELSREIYWHLLCHCKNRNSNWYQSEAQIMVEILKESTVISWPENPVTKTRLLHEMRNKQKFITGGPENLELTEMGRRYAQFLSDDADISMAGR